jgi:Uma2 family endonuclease
MAMNAQSLERDLPLVRLTVAQYHAMREARIFPDDAQIELLDGLLVPRMTKHPPHRLSTRLVRSALEAAVGSSHYVDSQEPITLADSEPEPDVVVVKGAPREYGDRHPGGADVALVVEVADDSLERDRGVKLRVYARAGIPQYWIVNLRQRSLEVYTDPQGDEYRSRLELPSHGHVPIVIEGRGELARVAVVSLLP